jgi:serine protease Do
VLGRRVRSTLTNTNVNYATPVEVVAECIAESQSGVVDTAAAPDAKPYHGIKLFDLGYNRKLVYVESVRPDSPAAKAGLRPDDLIMSLNGQPISRASQFTREIDQLRPGDAVTLGVKRGERLESVEFVLEAAP